MTKTSPPKTKKRVTSASLRKQADTLSCTFIDTRGIPTPLKVSSAVLARARVFVAKHSGHRDAHVRNRARLLAVQIIGHESLLEHARSAAKPRRKAKK